MITISLLKLNYYNPIPESFLLSLSLTHILTRTHMRTHTHTHTHTHILWMRETKSELEKVTGTRILAGHIQFVRWMGK